MTIEQAIKILEQKLHLDGPVKEVADALEAWEFTVEVLQEHVLLQTAFKETCAEIGRIFPDELLIEGASNWEEHYRIEAEAVLKLKRKKQPQPQPPPLPSTYTQHLYNKITGRKKRQ